jgi:polysaccharide biosynthesis/export protein
MGALLSCPIGPIPELTSDHRSERKGSTMKTKTRLSIVDVPYHAGVMGLALCALLFAFFACGTGGEIVKETSVKSGKLEGLKEKDRAMLDEIKKTVEKEDADDDISKVIEKTPHFTVSEYLAKYPEGKGPEGDYKVGGNDVLNITVYEEKDLSREAVRVSGKGYISFPLIGQLEVSGLATTDIEKLIADKLAEKQYLLNAHVSVMVTEYNSQHFFVLGAVESPGSYPLQARERVLDAISKVKGVEHEKASSRLMLIRTLQPNTAQEQKLVIGINLRDLLDKGDQVSNIHLYDRDVLYVSPVERYYIIGQVNTPGSYDMPENGVTLVEAIGMAGGFTRIASRNSTRIIRLEDGMEKIIEVKVDAITDAGKKIHDVVIKAGDIIVVPESFF